MKNQTALNIIIEKFNLLSDNDFKTWFLNSMDELEAMEKEQIEKAFKEGIDQGFYIGGGSK
jgi:hypothetical protein